jgi:Fe-S cluster assembly ATP-binding protein
MLMSQATPALNVNNLHVAIGDKEILRGVSFSIAPGEVHAIMGPNGSGKSTLAHALLGHPAMTVTSGDMEFQGKPVTRLATAERAKLGMFLAFQHPVAIEGITIGNLLRTATKSIRGKSPKIGSFQHQIEQRMTDLEFGKGFSERSFNEGFSGGERKKMEIVQSLVLDPTFLILDEIDSGLDVDALRTVAEKIQEWKNDKTKSILLITHYPRILQYIVPDVVHVMRDGKIIAHGDASLALKIEQEGFDASTT